jgi:hemolysin activation/secretion protein
MKRPSVSIIVTLLILPVFLWQYPCFAQQPRTSQELSGMERTRELEEKQKALEKALKKKKEKPRIEEKLPTEAAPTLPTEKVLIKTIKVTGVTLLSKKEIDPVIKQFENKELALTEMQKAADLITDAYRKKGYITSRAYLLPQKIENDTFEIRVIEGKMGDLNVKGNYYYKSYLFKKKFLLKKGEPFNYYILTRILRRINQQPDRFAKAVLVPGQEPGSTDVMLEVKDNLPIHASWDFDNYGSRYIYNNRYQFGARHNNLFGMGDIFDFKYMLSEADAYQMIGGSYILPVTDTFNLGFSTFWSKLHLLNDFKTLDIRGNSQIYSLFATQNIADEENFNFNLNAGLDVKDVFNFQQGEESSQDRMRVAKVGYDIDVTDPLGRTVMSNEINIGLPGFMAGSRSKDNRASVVGSGGEFVKFLFNIFRLQPMPFESMILWKNQAQVSTKVLTATEQYQIGGVINVRGYPIAELVGDQGASSTVEWLFPPYLIPKDIKIPFTQTRFYDAIRLVAFYDYGAVWLRKPGGSTKKFDQLSDFGWGVRFNLPKNFFFKAEFAYPINAQASDGKDQRVWIQISANY